MSKIELGAKVRYSASFLNSIACHSGPMPFAKGVVLQIKEVSKEFKLAKIAWDNPEIPTTVNVKNLSVCGEPEYFR